MNDSHTVLPYAHKIQHLTVILELSDRTLNDARFRATKLGELARMCRQSVPVFFRQRACLG